MPAASELEKGKFFEYKGELLQVMRRELVNCGTHSHTKLKFNVCNIYGKHEKVVTFAHNDSVDLVEIYRNKATVISKSAARLQIMDTETYETSDATAEKELLDLLKEGDEVTYIVYKGKKILGKK